jgi:cephalosporin hydroxylase
MRHFSFNRKESNIAGLKYIPYFADNADNDSDSLSFGGPYPPREVSLESYELVKQELLKYKDCKAILEIGIFQNIKGFSYLLSMEKDPKTIYVGLDKDERRYLGQPVDNIFILKSDSADREFVKSELRKLGVDKLSILFIDGFHSVNMVLNDFKYSELVEPGGLVILHDTNFHPGPNLVYQAVDENVFEKELYFDNPSDYGLAILRKK